MFINVFVLLDFLIGEFLLIVDLVFRRFVFGNWKLRGFWLRFRVIVWEDVFCRFVINGFDIKEIFLFDYKVVGE